MKKILNIVAAALMGVLALSSCAEKELTVYVPDNAVVPVLDPIPEPDSSYVLVEGENFATLTFSAADFGVVTAIRYTAYASLTEDFTSPQSLSSATTDTAGITISASTLNNALMALSCVPDEQVQVYFRVEASMMGESSTVGSVAALVSNVVSTAVTPYNAERTYPAVYVLGSFNSWSHDTAAYLFSYSEDENYTGVVDFGEEHANNEFKITGAAGWGADTGNWGVDENDASVTAEVETIQLINGDASKNIAVYTTYRYYNFSLNTSSLVLNMNKGFDKVTLAGEFNGWSTSATVMSQDRATGRFYVDVEIAAAGKFKFVIDESTWCGTGSGEGEVAIGGGDDIPIEAGNYRVYFNLNDWENPTYSLSTADYGKEAEDGGEDEGGEDGGEDPVTDPTNSWVIQGDFDNDSTWTTPHATTEFPTGSGIYVSVAINFAEGNEYKAHFNNWEKQMGAYNAGDTLQIGVPYSAQTNNGANFKVDASQAGSHRVVLNTNDNSLYLLGWGLIGNISGDTWSNDFPMTYNAAEGTWTANGVSISGEVKLRYNSNWDINYGLAADVTAALDTPLGLAPNGGNVALSEGVYNLVFDADALTLTVTAAE